MGIGLLIITIIIEIALAVFSIRTESYQNKMRNQVRIAALIAFMGGMLTSVIEWGFRWYFMFALLIILAVISGLRLWKNNFKQKPYKRWYIILKGIAMTLLFTIAILPALIFPQYIKTIVTGEYGVKSVTYTFEDNNRIETFADNGEKRKLTVGFWYPDNSKGEYPLIVFSHGAFGVKMSNESTFIELASNGYVVCSIDHPYHAAGTVDVDGNLTIGSREFMQEVIDVNNEVYSDLEQFELFEKWMDLRKNDINFILNLVIENAKNDKAEIYGLIDTRKIGLIGHSLGGAASAQLGRERSDINAVINLDGSMLGEYFLDQEGEIEINEKPYPLPLLNFYSEYVINELTKDPDFVYPNKFISSISKDAFEICISGTNHMSYTDLPLFSPMLANQLSGISDGETKATVDEYYCIETMNKFVLEFFNCYIKGAGEFSANE